MTDSQCEEQTRVQRFWLSETTLVTARSLAVVHVFFAVAYSWRFWRGSSVSPVFLVTVATLTIVFTWISVVSWVKRCKHNGLTAD